MMSTRINIRHIFLFIFMALGVMPPIFIGNIVLPAQYLFVPFGAIVFLFVAFDQVKCPPFAKGILVLWLLIILEVLISGIFGPMIRLDKFVLPTEAFQYVARMIIFLLMVVCFYRLDDKLPEKFLCFFLFLLFLGMLVGVLQWLPWGGAEKLTLLYTEESKRIQTAIAKRIIFRRVPGIAGHATANGGIAAFAFAVAISAYFFQKKHRKLSGLIMVLAAFNTLASQARMGYLTIAFILVVIYGLFVVVEKRIKEATMVLLAILSLVGGSVLYLYKSGYGILVAVIYRWTLLINQLESGGNRIEDIVRALSMLSGLNEFLFGISNFVRQSFGDMFIEVEPVNIFVLYGATGFVLQYLLIAILLLYFWRAIRFTRSYPALYALTIASFVSLLGYQFFSLAYYFYREMYVGLFPWILMGATMGMIEAKRRLVPETSRVSPHQQRNLNESGICPAGGIPCPLPQAD